MERCSEKVGAFVRGLRLDDIPREVRDKAKLILLDTLGIALASSTMDFGRMALDVAAALGGARESRLIGTSRKVAAANAVLANGTLAHGLDYDDTLEEAIVHTGCCGAITALAVGEAEPGVLKLTGGVFRLPLELLVYFIDFAQAAGADGVPEAFQSAIRLVWNWPIQIEKSSIHILFGFTPGGYL